MRGSKLVFLALVALAVPAVAQEDYRHGRIRYLEPGVTLQRGTETGAEEAVANLPYLPGDRVWTDANGRAEFQFEGGALVRLDSRSKLDYAAHDEGRDNRVVLRLLSGGLYLRVRTRNAEAFTVETPSGFVEARDRGVYRVDVDSGEVRLSVYEGQAMLDGGGRRVDLDAGERTYARRGEAPEDPSRFDRAEDDVFARWDEDRERREAWAAGSRKYLPDELDPYASEFESNGTWYYEGDVGYVWRPTVSVGWRPYWNGRWVWTAYGWTWTPYEPWGWAPFHYGRWGFSAGLGWYWIPGRAWGPGWVTWATAGDYVGWCPLGYRDRPVYGWGGGHGGYAVARGQAGGPSSAWAFVKRGDVGARDLAVRRVDIRPETVGDVRIADSPRVRPTRDARELREMPVTRDVAIPRNTRVKPTPADTVPELGPDRQTTIPNPAITRRGALPREDPTRPDRQPRADEVAVPRSPRDPERVDRGVEHPTDARSPRRSGTETPGAAVPRGSAREGAPPRPENDTRSERDRDVLRPLFRPLSEPRNRRPEEARPRDDGRARDDGRTRDDGRSRDSARPRDDGRAQGGASGRPSQPPPPQAAPPPERERRPPPQTAPPAPPPQRNERANPPPQNNNARSAAPARAPEQAHPRAKDRN
jgi:hypothetical protein